MYELSISTETQNVLKKLSDINNTLKMVEGDVLKSVASNRTIFAICGIDMNIPHEFNIFDLREFNQSLSLFEDPIIVFGEPDDGYIVITNETGDTKLKYWESESDFVTSYPLKELPQIQYDTELKLTADDIKKVLDASKILKLPYVGFKSDGDNVYLCAFDVNDDGDGNETNEFKKLICTSPNGDEFNMYMESNQMRILSGDFDVSISRSKIIKFESVDKPQEFLVTLKVDSEY